MCQHATDVWARIENNTCGCFDWGPWGSGVSGQLPGLTDNTDGLYQRFSNCEAYIPRGAQKESHEAKILHEVKGTGAFQCSENDRKLVIVVWLLIWLNTVSSCSSSSGCDTRLIEAVMVL